jgi:putative ABC transport system permease protein
MLADLKYALRMLVKAPGFTAVAVLTLALGVGANSAIFSVVNALLLKPLPFAQLERLVIVRSSLANQGSKSAAVSAADFKDWREQNRVFQQLAAYRLRDTTITGSGDPELVRGCFVSADFFSTVGVNAAEGRTLLAEEDQPGRNQVAVLGRGFWERQFGADPGVVGRTINLDGRAVTVIGIMPADFDFPFGAELWMPLALTPSQLGDRAKRNLQVLGRLRSSLTVAQARAEMDLVAGRLQQQHPQTNTGLKLQVIPLRDQQADFTRPLLSVLVVMAAFLLLIACANVANLLFARATTRQKEISIRAALGATRWRVVRQLMTESLLLSGLAGLAGLFLATWAIDLIKVSLPPEVARFVAGWKEIGINGGVLAFTLTVAVLTIFVFSLVPALQAARVDLNGTLKEGGRSPGTDSRGRRTRNFLVVSQIALALVLLVGAGLMIKGFWRNLDIFQGAAPRSILTLQTPLPESRYNSEQKKAEFYRQATQRLAALPGVQAVTLASNTPLNNRPNPNAEFLIEGRPALLPGQRQLSEILVISPGYFSTVGARLVRGRRFRESDNREATPVAIISELTARRYWPNEDPLGRRIRLESADPKAPWVTIVGVVSDLKQSWFDKEIAPQLYLPCAQAPRSKMTFMLRTSGDPLNLVAAARAQILAVDPNQPMDEVKTLARLFVDEASPFRFAAVLMLVFGAVALVMSAIGVYGVMSYSVAQRRHEIGIRMALGAQRRDLLGLFLRQGASTAALGLAIGLPLAWALSRVMSSLLFGIFALDYSLFAGFGLLLAGVAFCSICIPARRAALTNPIVALTGE